MAINQSNSLRRELRLMKSTLIVSKRRDVSGTSTGKLLQAKGYVSKSTGKITKKGSHALTLL